MKRLLLVACLALSLPAMAQNVATVNGQPILKTDFDSILTSMHLSNATTEQRKEILDNIIDRDVLAQEAINQGLDKIDAVRLSLDNQRKEILITSLLSKWNENHPIGEQEIKKAYDEMLKTQSQTKEYKVRHILVKTDEEAKAVIDDIKSKKMSFADAAKKKSLDPGSGRAGGELGWSQAEVYVPEFAAAVKRLKKDELSEPVKTQFGYHLIQLEDERALTPPSLEQATPELKQALAQENLSDWVAELRKKAKIEISPNQ